jgi:hypothetical protein
MLGQPLIGMYGNFLEMPHTSHSQEGGEIP